MSKFAGAINLFQGSEYEAVISYICNEYNTGERDEELRGIIAMNLFQLLQVTGALGTSIEVPRKIDTTIFQGKSLADIACGRSTPYPKIAAECMRRYEPWLSRLGVCLGMKVTGLDKELNPQVHSTHGGTWTYTKTDLFDCRRWSLADASQDCVTINGLIHARGIEEMAPELCQRIVEDMQVQTAWYLKKFRPHVLRESARILKPDGHLLLNSLHYRRTQRGWTVADEATRILLRRSGLAETTPENLPLRSLSSRHTA